MDDFRMDFPILPTLSDPLLPKVTTRDCGTVCLGRSKLDFVIFFFLLAILIKVRSYVVCVVSRPALGKQTVSIGEEAMVNASDGLPGRKVPWRLIFKEHLYECALDGMARHDGRGCTGWSCNSSGKNSG